MSKKSRRRNKRLLALAGLAGAVALSKRKAKADLASTEDGKGGIDTINKAKQAMTSDAAYSTKKDTSKSDVNVDTKPKTVVNRSRNKVIYSDGTSDTPGTLYQKNKIKNEMPNTAPPSIDNPYRNKPSPRGRGNFSMKSGGRAGLKSGGKVKGCGIAKRGLGRAMKKGKR